MRSWKTSWPTCGLAGTRRWPDSSARCRHRHRCRVAASEASAPLGSSLAGARIWLTFVTVGELAKWAVVRKWGQDRRDHLDSRAPGHPLRHPDRPDVG